MSADHEEMWGSDVVSSTSIHDAVQESTVGSTVDGDGLDNEMYEVQDEEDDEEIDDITDPALYREIVPDPIVPVIIPYSETLDFVSFNIESTGKSANPHITSIAASGPTGQFQIYVIPKTPINPQASKINGLTMRGNQMYLRGAPVDSYSISQALAAFKRYLGNMKVILVNAFAHKIDAPLLLKASRACNFTGFRRTVVGFSDTYELICRRSSLSSEFARKVVKSTFHMHSSSPHNGMNDVLNQDMVIEVLGLTLEDLTTATLNYNYMCDHLEALDIHLPSLMDIVQEKVITLEEAEMIAGSGLGFDHLWDVNGIAGGISLYAVLSEESPNGNIRVTRNPSLAQRLVTYFD